MIVVNGGAAIVLQNSPPRATALLATPTRLKQYTIATTRNRTETKRLKSKTNSASTTSTVRVKKKTVVTSDQSSEFTALKNEIVLLLNNSRVLLPTVELPALTRHAKLADNSENQAQAKPKLSILISDADDLCLTDVTDADVYFKLPDSYKRGCTKYVDFLTENPRFVSSSALQPSSQELYSCQIHSCL